MRKTIYILILAALVSCTKEGGSAGKLMEFSVSTPGVVSTKAEATLDGLKGTGGAVYVYGTKSDGSTSVSVFNAPGTALLINDSSTDVWSPGTYTWDDEMYYQFYGYAYVSNVNIGTNLTIPNETYGRQFTVTQPETGDGSYTIDYLLSYMVNVPPTTNHPLVPIRLEHAMAKVEVDVQIAGAMYESNSDNCLVDNISISVSEIKRKATMLCVQPKLDGEEGTNTWQVTFEDNAGTATYTKTISNTKGDNLSGTNAVAPDMSFIAVPVTNEQMGAYVLTLQYKGTKTGTDYTYTFNLKDFSPKGWVNGHKVRYILTIDNSIHLAGSIVDYEDVDYIEAVIVPGQGNNVQNP